MNDTEIRVINYFRSNPKSSITDIANNLDLSRAIVSKYLNKNSGIILFDNVTIGEQLDYNKVHGSSNGGIVSKNNLDITVEDNVVSYFKVNFTATFEEIADIFNIAKSTVSKYLAKHLNELVNSAPPITIEQQLIINKNNGRKKGADTIGAHSVALKNRLDGRFIGSISVLEVDEFTLTDKNGERIGSLKVSNSMEEKITREGVYYLLHGQSVEMTASKLGVSTRTLQLHLKKLEIYDSQLFDLIEKQKEDNFVSGMLKRIPKGGRKTDYSIEEINYLCDIFISKQMTYFEAEDYFDIPHSTLFELFKRVDDDRRSKLEELAINNKKDAFRK